jgi:hypothetical protein
LQILDSYSLTIIVTCKPGWSRFVLTASTRTSWQFEKRVSWHFEKGASRQFEKGYLGSLKKGISAVWKRLSWHFEKGHLGSLEKCVSTVEKFSISIVLGSRLSYMTKDRKGVLIVCNPRSCWIKKSLLFVSQSPKSLTP